MQDETYDERLLDNELKKLIKRANQRLLSIEKITGTSGSFASKQLYDYLSAKPINAITGSNRISLKKDYTLMQKKAILKATNEFLNKSVSTTRGLRSYISKYSNIAGKKLSPKMASTYYQVTHDLSWLYDSSMTESIFWRDFAPLVKTNSKESWIELVGEYKSQIPDRTIKRNLGILYDYVKNG